MTQAHIGVVGMAVMGRHLALNIESRGYTVAIYNRSPEKTRDLLEKEGKGKRLIGVWSPEELARVLEKPRKILLMVQAGAGTDEVIRTLLPHLEPGDIVIDGGNAHFADTERRGRELAERGIRLVGAGISGGEEGALKGPAIMPGGPEEAYRQVEPILTDIAAKADGEPCCAYMGPGGAGHFVKMVHNGIEYADMQLIGEAYHLLRDGLGLGAEELHRVFADWSRGELNSYLMEITADIFARKDPETGRPMVDVILDTAEQKGTGKWTSQCALDLGVPLSVITEAVFARFQSARKEERTHGARRLAGPRPQGAGLDPAAFMENVRKALFAGKICAYAQGFALFRAASEQYGWNLPLGRIALIFRGGCIIRARFLQNIADAFARDPDLPNLLMDEYFRDVTARYQEAWRETVAQAVRLGIPVPALSGALAYYDSLRCERLPANLLQAQRDFFGAHAFRRVDKEGTFHFPWQRA